jgi:nucleoid-associated protein YgaU
MPSQTVLMWAGATGIVVAAAGAGAVYWAQPDFLWPNPVPAVVIAGSPLASTRLAANAPAPDKTVAAPSLPASAPAVTPAASPPGAVLAAAVKPTFDVVSVEPTGDTVVAGRAAPNVKVALLDSGKRLAETTSDAQGQFVMIPSPLPPGDHSLTLSSGAGGAAETSISVPVSVAAPPPKVAAAPAAEGSQAPSSAAPLPAPTAGADVAIQSVEANADGGLTAKGVAQPNATVRLYVGGAYVGDARTKADGRWSLTIEHGMSPGAYVVRADEIEPGDAKVVARAEASFNVPALAAPEKPVSAASAQPPTASSPSDVVVNTIQIDHVERGQTLWGISQKFYGDGSRYAIIFAANSGQIRNPNLIYPGQNFIVPKAEPKP